MPLRYQADERPPHRLALGLGAQTVALTLSGIVLTPVIVLRAGGVEATLMTWAIFMALLISGLCTIIQARPVWRFGAGYVLFMGTSGAFIAIATETLLQGGMALLMTLIITSAFLEFVMADRLSALRRIVTPTVGGITLMLIAVTVMPIAFGMLGAAPAEVVERTPLAPVAAALITFLVTICLSFFADRRWRLWSPLLGLAAGSAVAAGFGLLDLTALREATWIGVPTLAWPGLDLSFGPAFWGLLPAFLIVTIVSAIETYGDGIAIQRISWRKPRAVDYRAVQGGLYADSLGNLLSGLGGTLPNTTYSTSISAVELTGVAARRVGIYGGLLLALLAFSPKVAALLLCVPEAVVGSYLVVLIVLLFMHGLELALRDGFTFDRALVIGLSLWLGLGFQDQKIFYDLMPHWAAALLSNGMTAGVIVALSLTLLLRLKSGRRRELVTALRLAEVPQVQSFVREKALAAGWDRATIGRLELVVEEALVFLVEHTQTTESRQLRVEFRAPLGAIELDLLSAPAGANLQDSVAGLQEAAPEPETDLSLRILASLVDDIRHQQFHGVDVLALRLLPRDRVEAHGV
jgi:xanthine permease XanP